jgi:tRNA (mo5U34)-methyltransferase
VELEQLGWYHSIELPNGQVIRGHLGIEELRSRLARFSIPENLDGKRVLDIGAWDGWFSFEMERRGARVVAIDSARQTRFLRARELLGSAVEYHIADICHVSSRELGYFDIVLFFGVLYHVKHPMLALENVCELATDMACVESYVSDDGTNPDAVPLMEFYETTELRGQFDNWVGPNTACLLAFCRTAGFASVRLESVIKNRASVTCLRKWPGIQPAGAGPFVTCVENSVSRDHKFSSANDDYAAFWFESDRADLRREDLFPQIGPYGSHPAGLCSAGPNEWHVNCKLPPGLSAGWHDARLRIGASELSNPVRIGIDVSEEERRRSDVRTWSGQMRVDLVTDGKNWERYRVRVGNDSCVSLWLSGIPEDCDRRDIRLRLNGTDIPAHFLSPPDREGRYQVNALLPSGLRPGDAVITLAIRGIELPPVSVQLVETGG